MNTRYTRGPKRLAWAAVLCTLSASALAEAELVVLDPALLQRKDSPKVDEVAKLNAGAPSFVCFNKSVLPQNGSAFAPLGATDGSCLEPRVTKTAGHVYRLQRLTLVQGSCDKPEHAVPGLDIQFKEERRETAFVQSLRAVFGAVLARAKESDTQVAAADSKPAQKWVWCLEPRSYTQTLKRSTVTITAKPEGATDDKTTAQLSYTTGPKEHWFLSGDAVVRGANELKWDATTRSLKPQDKPNQLYLGFNYMLGDVYGKADARSTDRLVFKFMLQPTRRPFDSVGVGLGYRFADGGNLLTNTKSEEHSGAVLFVGHFWTRGDQADAAGTVSRGGYDKSWRLGVSYSVGSLLQWLQ